MSYQRLSDDAPDAEITRIPSFNVLQPDKSPRSPQYHHHRRASTRSRVSIAGKTWFIQPPWSSAATHTAISIAAGTVMCLFGYEQGVFGGIIVGTEFNEYFNEPSPSLVGFVTSVYDLGCFAGAVLTLFVGEMLGRKRMLIVFTIIMASGIVLQTVAQDMQWLLWGRFIAGIGNGGNTATAPVWHVETSHQNAKGQAVVKEMVVNVLGFVVSNIITLACSGITTEAQWRFPLGIQLFYIVVILMLVPILPESPRWLCAKNRDAEAKAMLEVLSEEDVEEEFKSIKESVRKEQAVQVSWAKIFKGGTATRRMLLGMGLQVAQQLTGINVLCYYLPLVLHKSVGLSELASRLLATGNAVCYMLATAASLLFIERLGRRPLLMAMAAAQSVAFLGISISTEIGHENGAHIPGIVATIFISMYFLAFGFGWVATPWLYPAEVNSLSMRTKGAALATACDWLFNYFVVQTTPIGIHHLKWGLYLVYSVLNAAFVPLIYFFIVETAGKSLEQIDRWFAAHPGWFVHKIRDRSDEEDEGEERDVRAPLKHQESDESDSMVKDFERRYDGSLERSRRRTSGESLYKVGSRDSEGDDYET
ncbi:uncharacterized protein KY384_009229 [Bacidia gigantensis]|uniref:uncharacterized protein n=1 Tax=Bacidia gigantensis TaxID=2732470 RepID=UPI001D05356A|nr:uncharacterized protein KY384_009229 [Bacidia gigantensis]KAG8525585.1 hypothetical protein KY384_009229 [Bacidia gigantensis]